MERVLVAEAPLPKGFDAIDQAGARRGRGDRRANAADHETDGAKARAAFAGGRQRTPGATARQQALVDARDESFVSREHQIFGVELEARPMGKARFLGPLEPLMESAELRLAQLTSAGARAQLVEVVFYHSPSITSRKAG